jgi:hypothetical protein
MNAQAGKGGFGGRGGNAGKAQSAMFLLYLDAVSVQNERRGRKGGDAQGGAQVWNVRTADVAHNESYWVKKKNYQYYSARKSVPIHIMIFLTSQ